MTAKRLRKYLPVLAFASLLSSAVSAQIGVPVETGLAQLAQQIVSKSAAAGKATVAVLPFPNADGSCSVLSNFIADELIQTLFSVPGSKLEIVERAQLETIIKELKLGASGLLNPETTKKLGSQSGVSALTVGTITVIGDTVRINARLIATDTGKAISAAAVDVPKIPAVIELLKQPVSTGPTCGRQTTQSAEPAPGPTPKASAEKQNINAADMDRASGLRLDVRLVQGKINGYPEQPTGISLASMHDERVPSFGYGAIMDERELEP